MNMFPNNETRTEIVYIREPLDHLIDTLLRLSNAYEDSCTDASRNQIEEAMKEINRQLKEQGEAPYMIKSEVK